MNEKIVGLMAILVFVLMASGCTSNNNSSDPKSAALMTPEQIKANATQVGGEELQRNAMSLKNESIKITGTVQAKDITALVITMDNPNYIVKIETVGPVPEDIIIGDIVTVYGVCQGLGSKADGSNPIPIVEAWSESIVRT